MSGFFWGDPMRRLIPIRLLVVAVAASSLTAIPLAQAASAATGTVCTGAKTVTNVKTFIATTTLTGCTNAPATGGKGVEVVNFKNTSAITATITWNKTGTTLLKISEKGGPKVNKCPAGSVAEIVSTGSVTGGTGSALKLIPKGTKLSESVCYNSKNVVTLYPGSKFVL
jgi:hypothetical protein